MPTEIVVQRNVFSDNFGLRVSMQQPESLELHTANLLMVCAKRLLRLIAKCLLTWQFMIRQPLVASLIK